MVGSNLPDCAARAAFYQGIGVLVQRGMIDIELVNDLLGHSVVLTWEKMSPELIESRKSGTGKFSPILWKDFEFLYNEISKRRSDV